MAVVDDIDLPELTEEHLAELRPKAVDLHLGPAEVKAVKQDWWIKEYGPKPPSLFVRTLDVIIVLMTVFMLGLLAKVWIWVFVN
jgi:hypothetical protein